jgi:predicted RNA-binding Zn-ribbon protein involved in translation (DUF1610 family)
MNDETKKYVGITVAAIFLLLAGMYAYRTMFGGSLTGPVGNKQMALLCTSCGGFEIPVDEFRDLMNKNSDSMMMGMPGQLMAMECPKCGQKTCYRAQKCPQCENIFVFGQAKDQNYPDRCPKCMHSKNEDKQKN